MILYNWCILCMIWWYDLGALVDFMEFCTLKSMWNERSQYSCIRIKFSRSQGRTKLVFLVPWAERDFFKTDSVQGDRWKKKDALFSHVLSGKVSFVFAVDSGTVAPLPAILTQPWTSTSPISNKVAARSPCHPTVLGSRVALKTVQLVGHGLSLKVSYLKERPWTVEFWEGLRSGGWTRGRSLRFGGESVRVGKVGESFVDFLRVNQLRGHVMTDVDWGKSCHRRAFTSGREYNV